ncbi:MAG: hypothetical protein V3V08_13545 [Nannocystaceae bacterium]
MYLNTKRASGLLCIAFAASATSLACDDGTPGIPGANKLIEECGLTCAAEGIADGNASISGVASIDAFFSSVISVRDAAIDISASMRAELNGMGASLGIEGAAEMDISDLSAEIEAKIKAKIQANVEGSLIVNYDPPKCEANLEVTAKAAAECDVEAKPAEINVQCEGSCEVSAEAAVSCNASGNLTCEGQAPSFACDGTCTGSCQLEAAASCSGTCNGTCNGTCTACAGGGCDEDGGDVTNCAGSCEGTCQGECKLEAGGSCEGRCEGSCEYTPGEAGCEGSATAKCDASAQADVKCEGSCEGEVKPPKVSAECEASVEAKASADLSCTPPALTVEFQFKADFDADAKAEFKAWLEGFKARFSAMLALNAKLVGPNASADGGLKASIAGLGAAAEGAVKGAVDAQLDGDLSLKGTVGLGCALKQLKEVGNALGSASSTLGTSVSAFAEVSGSVSARRAH